MRTRLAALAVAIMAVTGGCGGGDKSVKRSELEKGVADQLDKQVGQRPKKVDCPKDLKAKKGTAMRCRLEADDGSKIGLTVTVTSVEGSKVRYAIKVDRK
ncbi:DUF4333 domain-containing protein [Spirillospora sp. CA-294931]|uniref:DUF4333 domain-containing protein n=1 Tax=Spirillospora sp. CA-294931 TaxID=3240042 RepID=UPI003D8B5611